MEPSHLSQSIQQLQSTPLDDLERQIARGERSGDLRAVLGDELASEIDVREELAKVQARTLVAHARQDGNAPLTAGQDVAAGIPDSRFVELDSANHIILGNEPAWGELTREMRAFLKA